MSDEPKMTPKDFEDIMGAIEDSGGKVVRVEKVKRGIDPAEQELADTAAALLARLDNLRHELTLTGAALLRLNEHSANEELQVGFGAAQILMEPALVDAVRDVARTLPKAQQPEED